MLLDFLFLDRISLRAQFWLENENNNKTDAMQ